MAPYTFWARQAWSEPPDAINLSFCETCLSSDYWRCTRAVNGRCGPCQLTFEVCNKEGPWEFRDIPDDFWLLFYLPALPSENNKGLEDTRKRWTQKFLWNAPPGADMPSLHRALSHTFLLPHCTALKAVMGDQLYDVDMHPSLTMTVLMNHWTSKAADRYGMWRSLAQSDMCLSRYRDMLFCSYKRAWNEDQRKQWTNAPPYRRFRMCTDAFGYFWDDRATVVIPLTFLCEGNLTRDGDHLSWVGKAARDGWQAKTMLVLYADGEIHTVAPTQYEARRCDCGVVASEGQAKICLGESTRLRYDETQRYALEEAVDKRVAEIADAALDEALEGREDPGLLLEWGEVWDTLCDESH